MGRSRKTDGDAGSTSLVADLFRGIRSIFPRRAGEAKPLNKEKMLFNFFIIDILVCIVRIAVAVGSNSMAMYTTAARAVISILTAFIAWVCMRFASKDESDAFNYGYGKLESISSIVKGAALLISFVLIMYVATGRLSHPGKLSPVGAEIAIAFSFFFTCGNIYRWFRIRRFLSNGDRSPVISVVDRMQKSLETKIHDSRITIIPRSSGADSAVPAAAPEIIV